MNTRKHVLIAFIAVCTLNFSCNDKEKLQIEESWETNLASDSLSWVENWIDDSSQTNTIQYKYENGSMRFWTDKGSKQRPKLTHKKRTFTIGQYFWRVYIPAMGMYNRVSVGAFLYRDDSHELDFEIGPGRKEIRDALKTKDDEVVMYLTSQEFPAHQSIHSIKTERWYNLSIRLTTTEDSKYLVEWLVDNKIIDSIKLGYGPEVQFGIHCSLENLQFMGDVYATQDHYCLFKSVGFKPIQ